MNKLINREKLQYTINQLWKKLKTSFGQLNGENTFTKKNVFDEAVMIKRESMYVGSPINNDPITLTGQRKFAGCRKYTSHSNGNNGFVKSVKLKIKEDYRVGDTLRYIDLWAVEKKDSLDQDIVLGKLHNANTTYFTVKEEEGFGKYIEMFVNRKFDTPTYFLVGHNNHISYTKTVAEDDDNVYGNLDLVPEDGNTGIVSTHRQYLLQYGLVGESMNLAKELEKFSNTAGDFVSSVNGERPDDRGNVTIEPSNIPGLLSPNNKIHPDLIPEVAITTVTVVNSEEEAMRLTSSIGDIVIRMDLQGESYICKNPQADTFAERFVRIGSASDAVKTINGESAIAGNVVLGLTSDGTQIKLTANSHDIAALPIITEQEVNDIINALV